MALPLRFTPPLPYRGELGGDIGKSELFFRLQEPGAAFDGADFALIGEKQPAELVAYLLLRQQFVLPALIFLLRDDAAGCQRRRLREASAHQLCALLLPLPLLLQRPELL